jgi:hypothetical protein
LPRADLGLPRFGGDLGRQRALLDLEHIRDKPRALTHSLDVRHHTRDMHRRLAGQLPLGYDHVVQLQVLIRADRHRELQRRRGDGAYDEPDRIVVRAGCVRHVPRLDRTLALSA